MTTASETETHKTTRRDELASKPNRSNPTVGSKMRVPPAEGSKTGPLRPCYSGKKGCRKRLLAKETKLFRSSDFSSEAESFCYLPAFSFDHGKTGLDSCHRYSVRAASISSRATLTIGKANEAWIESINNQFSNNAVTDSLLFLPLRRNHHLSAPIILIPLLIFLCTLFPSAGNWWSLS